MILTLGWGDSVEMQPEMMCEHGLSGEWDRKWAFVEKKPQRERLMKKENERREVGEEGKKRETKMEPEGNLHLGKDWKDVFARSINHWITWHQTFCLA